MNFTWKVRIIHKLIKTVHHRNNVSQDQSPGTISKMTHTLTTLIQPALPTERTIMGKNWTHTTLIILMDHYKDLIQDAITDLLSLPDTEWQDPFKVEANWTRRNLGRRLLPELVREAENIITANFGERDVLNAEGEPTVAVPSGDTQTAAATRTERPAAPPPPSSPPPMRTGMLRVTAQVHRPLSHSPPDLISQSPDVLMTSPLLRAQQ